MENRRGAWGLKESQGHSSLGNGREGGPRKLQARHSFTSVTEKAMEWLILVVISEHVEGKKLMRNSEDGFTEGKFCLIAFDGMTAWVYEGTAVNVVYLDFSRLLTVSLIGKHAQFFKVMLPDFSITP